MIQLTNVPNILKSGKMTLHMDPHFRMELRIDSELGIDHKLELLQRPGSKMYYFNPDCCRVRVDFLAEHDIAEFYPYLVLADKQYKSMYELFADCLFRVFKEHWKAMDLYLENIEVKNDPITAGFFNKYTFDRIMQGSWAYNHVDFECEEYTAGSCSEDENNDIQLITGMKKNIDQIADKNQMKKDSKTKGDIHMNRDIQMANDRQMNSEALNRMEKLGICEKQVSLFKDSYQIPLTIVEGNMLKMGRLSDEEFDIAMKISEDNNYIIYYAIRNTGCYMDGTEFNKLTFLVVTPYKSDWANVCRDIEKGIVEAYVYNKDIPDYSELTGVKIVNVDGVIAD